MSDNARQLDWKCGEGIWGCALNVTQPSSVRFDVVVYFAWRDRYQRVLEVQVWICSPLLRPYLVEGRPADAPAKVSMELPSWSIE